MPEAIGSEPSAPSFHPMAGRSMAILYGTETGNSEELAGELGKMAERLHFDTVVDEMNRFNLKDILQFSLVIFVTSTTGQGDMPKNASGLWKSLLRKKLPPNCLRSMRFTIFALGDSSYPKFNWAARKLHRRLSQLGALEFFKGGEGDERHDDGIDSIFVPWYQDLRAALLADYPLPASVQPIPDEVQLPPRIILRLASNTEEHVTSKPPLTRKRTSVDAGSAPDDLLPIPDTFKAHLVTNSRVTPPDHWQDVRLLTFHIREEDNATAIPNLLPGSTLVIYPKNYPEDVQQLIDLMGWNGLADRPLERVPYVKRTAGPNSLPHSLRSRFSGASKVHTWDGATLRDLLTHNFDITSVPKRNFIRELAAFTTSDMEKERLQELTAMGNLHDFYDYTSRPRRTILELLQDFPHLKIPFERTMDLFPVIRGREFSIANGGVSLRADSSGDPGRVTVEILAAMVEYRTIIRKPRQGLCSRYLKHLADGATLRVGLKTSPSGPACDGPSTERPLIAIATGTGIAPIRSLIQERQHARSSASSASHPVAPTVLFFGCRNESADFHFRHEWEATPDMRVVPAFSRDPVRPDDDEATAAMPPIPDPAPVPVPVPGQSAPPAVQALASERGRNYVQHQIRRRAAEVAALVGRGAMVCLCGNAGLMPLSVKEALLDSLVLGGLVGTRAEAEEFWPGVAFWQETW